MEADKKDTDPLSRIEAGIMPVGPPRPPVQDRNCLSYWLPRLVAAGVPTPLTEIVTTSLDLTPLFDGEEPPGFPAFLDELAHAAAAVGGVPCFFRTGQTSDKHSWSETAFLADLEALPRHIARLCEFHEMAWLPRPTVWAVRELLPVEPVATLPAYGGFPLVPEVRCFVEGGEVRCAHSYWPEAAVLQGLVCAHGGSTRVRRGGLLMRDDGEGVCPLCAAEASRLFALAQAALLLPGWERIALQAADAFRGDGAWSVDLLPTRRGFFVTDMAEAERSWHWPGCVNGPSPDGGRGQ